MEGCREYRGPGEGNGQSAPCPHGPLAPRRSRGRPRNGSSNSNAPWWKAWMTKYVIACMVCGGLSVFHGVVFIVIYLLLRSYTSSLQFFETIPTYVPGVVFIITGLMVMCFVKRKNRYAFLIKMCGGCCVLSALLCVVVTVTTTVIHMNRLQTLHECIYTPQAATCMCVSAIGDHSVQDAHRFVFNNTPNCEVVHGSLYSCLRALFSFSVLGILLCISCSMLVYQLLSHEKKRIYWEQLELRRRFLYQRHSHHSVCGCYDELYPWPLWEMLDYRFLASHNHVPGITNLDEEQCPTQNTVAANNTSSGSGSNGHRASGWNWLPWPRHNANSRSRSRNCEPQAGNNELPQRQSFMRRLMSREGWNNQLVNSNGSPEESPVQADPNGTLPWRSECIHIFRPSPRSNNCLPPVRFGIRSRNSPYGRPYSSHRRTRSNDGVFHHLHMNPAPRYTQPYSLVDASGGISCHFTGCEIPRYMWGPPPPYSQPPSCENLALYSGNAQTHRRSSMGIVESGIELGRALTALEIEQSGNGSLSSKMSTPLSERRFVCHNFSSDGITLTIGGNYTDLCSQNTVNREHKREETCIVEVHVPYIFHKNDIVFNTLPTRSCRKKDINPFKSLSNIPLGLSRKINSLKSENSDELSVIKTCCNIKDSLNNVTQIHNVEASLYNSHGGGLKSVSGQLFYESNRTDTSPSSLSFQPTLVEVPSDFKSSLVIATEEDDATLANRVYAQSMPNLTLSNSSLVCNIRRAPSSGNTSTSQDFADFDMEEDSSPLVLCSPVSDIQLLPDDNASDSSSSYPPCPHVFRIEHEAPFSNDSSSEVTVGNEPSSNASSCEMIVIDGSRHTTACQKAFRCRTSDSTTNPTYSSPSIIISKRPPTECPINCSIRHLHRYHSEKIERRNSAQQDRTSNFVVTIKSVNV